MYTEPYFFKLKWFSNQIDYMNYTEKEKNDPFWSYEIRD